jgi:hypothetical protein
MPSAARMSSVVVDTPDELATADDELAAAD